MRAIVLTGGLATAAQSEKLNREISESYRYIVRSPDVRGGNAHVEGTRIAVHDVIGLLQNGETLESLVASCLPMLTNSHVYECLAYYEDHRWLVAHRKYQRPRKVNRRPVPRP